MNKRTGIIIRALCFLTFLLAVVLPAGASSKPILIKIGIVAPEGSAWVRALNAIDTVVRQKTAGRVRLRIYAGGVLGDEKNMVRKMYIGQIQGAVLTSAGMSTIYPEMDVFQIPFLFRNYAEADEIVKKMNGFFQKGFRKRGYILAGWSEGGFVQLMSTQPIATISDLKKMKVWTWSGSPMAKAIFKEAGVAAIPLSITDVLVGLQTGLVNVVYAPPSGAISLQWFTRIKYITDLPVIYLIGGILIKDNVFQKLSPAHQQVLLESFQRHMLQLKNTIRKENLDAIRVMRNHGVKIVKPTEKQIDEFKQLSARAMQHLGNKSYSRKIKDRVDGYLEAFRKAKSQ